MPNREPSTHLDVYWVNQYAVPPDQPGGTRHYDFALALTARGHVVHLLASDLNLTTRRYSRRRRAWNLLPINESFKGANFIWLTAGSYRNNDWRRVLSMAVFGVGAMLRLLFVPTRGRQTVFIGSSPHLFGAFGTWIAAILRRVPFVLEVRDLWPESYSEVAGRTAGPEVAVMRWIADRLYRNADIIMVLAEANRDRIIQRGVAPDRIIYVPNGVDLDAFLEGEPAIDLSSPHHFTFVYAGAHGPANDLATVIKACSILQGEGRNDIRVVLLGDGPSKPDLLELAASLQLSNVCFEDPVPKASIGPTLRTADAALMVLAPVELFTYGVSPNKLFDYLAANLRVVTNVPGLVSDIVTESDSGVCTLPGSAAALAEGMKAMADAPATDHGNGTRYVRENFDRRALAIRVESALITLAARGRSRSRPSSGSKTAPGTAAR